MKVAYLRKTGDVLGTGTIVESKDIGIAEAPEAFTGRHPEAWVVRDGKVVKRTPDEKKTYVDDLAKAQARSMLKTETDTEE